MTGYTLTRRRTENAPRCPSAYALTGKSGAGATGYGFRVGAYDKSVPLVIDPVMLFYCGYIGGGGTDSGFGAHIAVDDAGNAYLTGTVNSTEATLPVLVGPDMTFNGDIDAIVAKVNPAGTALIYLGYIGGAGMDVGHGIAVDGAGAVYIVSQTTSDELTFPATVGPDLTFNGGANDVFVAKVNLAGDGLEYCGYIGGAGDDQSMGLAIDSAGSAYVVGLTTSGEATFPVTVGPDLAYNGARDAFLAKVDPTGTRLEYCGYIGGAGDDVGYGIAVDGAGSAYVAGTTASGEASFPVVAGPGLTYQGGASDAFVAKVDPTGAALVYCGYIGGGGGDVASGVAVDGAGGVYVVGGTSSTEATFPVIVGPDLTYNGGDNDAFVAKIGGCAVALQAIIPLKMYRLAGDAMMSWPPDPGAGGGSGYNVWYVTDKIDIPLANILNQPPAVGVTKCSPPLPALNPACIDVGAVGRDWPTLFFYQVKGYCGGLTEGP